MKVVYFYPRFVSQAGTERILIEKANYLAEQYNYEIVLLTFQQGNHPFAFPLSDKVRKVDLDVPYDSMYRYNYVVRFWKWHQMDNILQERFDNFVHTFHPDIIISTTGFAIVTSVVVDCSFPVVRIAESHVDMRHQFEHSTFNKRSYLRRVRVWNDMRTIQKNIRYYNLLVALNQEDAKDWSRFVRTEVITNVVHLNSTGNVASLQSKRVIFAGRYVPQKGLLDLLKIWTLVYNKHPDWHLDLYGDGEQRGLLLDEATRIQANVHIHQSDSQIFNHYLESSIFVLTSLFEPFGLVLPEAMSCGLPVVAFNCPYGPSEIITNGIDGFLVENRDIKQFADCICQLIESEPLRRQMGKAAIASSHRFSPEKVIPKWHILFESFFK